MKKGNAKILVVTLLMVLSAVLPAAAWQENFRASSDEVQTLMQLKRISGATFPQLTYPVTGDQLLQLLERIDTDRLDSFSMNLYRELKDRLEHPPTVLRYKKSGAELGFTVLAGEIFKADEILPAKDRLPVFDFDITLFITENFTGKIDLDGNLPTQVYTALGDVKLHSYANVMNIMSSTPHRAYGSIGTKHINFTAGRDRISAGEGATGNLGFSENFLYEDYGKFSILYGPFAYDFTAILFESYGVKSGGDPDEPEDYTYLKWLDFNSANKVAFTHRFSGTIMNRVTASIYEGAVVYGKNILSELRFLNPFMMIHDGGSYRSGSVNNYFGLEINVPVAGGIQVNAQGFLDQLKLSTEADDSGNTAFGVLVNVQGSWRVGDGILSAYTEGVYGSPEMYCKEIENPRYQYLVDEGVAGNYAKVNYRNIDLVGAYNHYWDNNIDYEEEYMGYRHGGNLVAAGVGASYQIKRYTFAADVFFKAKGSHGLGVNEYRGVASGQTEKAREYCLIASVCVKGEPFNGVKFAARLGSVNYWNYQHEAGTKHDVQFSFGITLEPTSIIPRQGLV